MILHVARSDKFIPPFANLIKCEFNKEEHKFWITGDLEKYPIENATSVYLCGGTYWHKFLAYIKLFLYINSSRKIILHGLFEIRVVLIIALCPWVLTKCYWAIWGGDLYQHGEKRVASRLTAREMLRHFVIKRIGHLITYISGDVDLARKWYNAKGIHHECLIYLSNVIDPNEINRPYPRQKKDGFYILLGNSADPSNNHIEILEKLLRHKNGNITIFAPLSYGDQIYAKMVIEKGQEWFGDKFVPLVDFMPPSKYSDFLKSIDIAIFNHRRQQAMGNTITLIGMGKTIFMRSDVTQWCFLKSLGITINDINHLNLAKITTDTAQHNSRIAQSYFSKRNLIHQLEEIFE